MPTTRSAAFIAARTDRVLRLLLAAILVGSAVLVSRPASVRAQDETFAGAFFIESSYLATYDHAMLWVWELVDPTSIPDPADFRVSIDGIEEPITDVDYLYQGLVGSPYFANFGMADGTAFLEVTWQTPAPADAVVTFDYVGPALAAHPLRDLAGNPMPAQNDAEFFKLDFAHEPPSAFLDEGAGPETVVLFFPEPLQSALPQPGAFRVFVDGNFIAEPVAIQRREPHLGATVIYLTLENPLDLVGATIVELSYSDVEAAPQLLDRNSDLVPAFVVPVNVSLSPMPTRQTDPGMNVAVAPADDTTGAQLATVTFQNVTGAGMTTLTTTETAPPIPAGFSVGEPPTFYDIETTATFSGAIEVCIRYGAADYTDAAALRLLHFEDPDWIDVTTSHDQGTQTICGSVTGLSPFAVVEPTMTFDGFFSPVDNPPVLNSVNGGRAIPVKFSLGGDFGLDIFVTEPMSRRVPCPSEGVVDPIEEVVTSQSGLTHDAGTDRYQLVWKSSQTWAGTCRELILSFSDGSQETALFRFK